MRPIYILKSWQQLPSGIEGKTVTTSTKIEEEGVTAEMAMKHQNSYNGGNRYASRNGSGNRNIICIEDNMVKYKKTGRFLGIYEHDTDKNAE